ncbi:three component ABC system middle component [Clostridium botulinum]|uniref:three component ABC system middle component n=1 Tax=Clostridium botulinum TaxID=1491 RepID=UPI0007DE7B4A|nr:three component ABC system middle component [Clostridium botulinum]KEI92418.1 hypothetical protein N491_11340 [Clostridium botulinum B2 275]NFD57568.1 hypothetical protein [Clostridium botulinum]
MIDIEYKILQNTPLSSILLWKFVLSFEKNKNDDINIFVLLIILPIIYNTDSRKTLYSKKLKGGLYRAINENKYIILGLQNKVNKMAVQTLRALNMACACGLLGYKNGLVFSIKKNINKYSLNKIEKGEVKEMIKVSEKLGYWFSQMTIDQICLTLGVDFYGYEN